MTENEELKVLLESPEEENLVPIENITKVEVLTIELKLC